MRGSLPKRRGPGFFYNRRSNMFCLSGQKFGQITELHGETLNFVEKSCKIVEKVTK